MKLILASSSPRREEILRNAGYEFEVIPSRVDENLPEPLPPEETVTRLAVLKAGEIFSQYPDAVVLGADTVVSVGGKILGKPKDEQDAAGMLEKLSGRTHEVFSGVALMADGRRESFAEKSQVCFYPLGQELIKRYTATGEPLDKAGAYGIQGFGSLLVREITGDYYNVMGLPVARLGRALENFGITPLWR
ncbi:MAG TPA: Maf family protein [Clostridia bacterium]|nr:Maf family protein [Clostridia bacterium]